MARTATAHKLTTDETGPKIVRTDTPAPALALATVNGKIVCPACGKSHKPGSAIAVKHFKQVQVTPATEPTPEPTPETAPEQPADGPTEAEAEQIAHLESDAQKSVKAGERAAMTTARAIVQLHPLAPWRGKTVGGKAMTPAQYYATVIGVGKSENDLFPLPIKARQFVVKEMDGKAEIETIMVMTGNSKRTIIRDRKELGIARADNKPAETPETPEAPETEVAQPAAPAAGALRMVISIPDFVGKYAGDADALRTIITLAQEALADLEAE